jgi:hypothetical protein
MMASGVRPELCGIGSTEATCGSAGALKLPGPTISKHAAISIMPKKIPPSTRSFKRESALSSTSTLLDILIHMNHKDDAEQSPDQIGNGNTEGGYDNKAS